MASIGSLLSRIFGSKKAQVSQTEAVQESVEAEKKEALPPEPDYSLSLDNSHPLNKLYDQWREQTEDHLMPKMNIQLELPERMDKSVFPQELARLRLTLTTAANARASKAIPKDPEAPLPDLDAQAVVFITNDKLSAYIMVLPPVGEGEEVNENTLDKALSDNKVSYGIDEDLLAEIPDKPIGKRYFCLYHIAEGEAAVHGEDGKIIDKFSRSPEKKYAVDEYDRMDYTSLNLVQNAEQGDVICEIIYPTEGEPGMNVLRQEIPAKNGKNVQIPKGRNTELDEDETNLIASITGHVEFNGRTFEIKPVLEIDGNIDYSTGNINYVGDVNIHGDVCNGFTVRAMGSITVDGVIESGNVEAGGDLIVAKGIVGNNNSTVIRAQRSIYSKYLENCSVYARENLQADFIINCKLYANGEIEVKSGRGAIIGGVTRAGKAVRANLVGSMSEVTTAIRLGGMPCEEFEKELVLDEIKDLEKELEQIVAQPESPKKSAQAGKARMRYSMAKLKLEQLEKTLKELEAEADDDYNTERLECDTAFTGTEITIGGVTLRLNQEYRKCTARLVDGEIRVI